VGPFLVNPLTRGRAITLTFDQFKYGRANALDEKEAKEAKEAKELYDTFHIAGSGISRADGQREPQPADGDEGEHEEPARGSLLIIDGENDPTVPWAIANAAYQQQSRKQVVTEIVKIPNRGHSLTIGQGWREVAQRALDFVQRFVPAQPG
jgi:non-heme chloroperoxidase